MMNEIINALSLVNLINVAIFALITAMVAFEATLLVMGDRHRWGIPAWVNFLRIGMAAVFGIISLTTATDNLAVLRNGGIVYTQSPWPGTRFGVQYHPTERTIILLMASAIFIAALMYLLFGLVARVTYDKFIKEEAEKEIIRKLLNERENQKFHYNLRNDLRKAENGNYLLDEHGHLTKY